MTTSQVTAVSAPPGPAAPAAGRPASQPDEPDQPDDQPDDRPDDRAHDEADDPADDQPDDALVERVALGDHRAFATLVGRHGAALYRYARRLLPCAQDAEDAVQDALTAAWLGADRFRGDASVRTWLFGIQTNCVRRSARRRAHTAVPVPDQEGGPSQPRAGAGGDPVEQLLATDLRTELDSALADLPGPQRAAWLLVEVEGMSYADAAQALRTTHGAVRGLLGRARAALGGRFAPWR